MRSPNTKILIVEDTIAHRQLLNEIFKELGFEFSFVNPPEQHIMSERLTYEWVIDKYNQYVPDVLIVDMAWNAEEAKILGNLLKEMNPAKYWKDLEYHNKTPQVFKFLSKVQEDQASRVLPVVILTAYKPGIADVINLIFPSKGERKIIQKPEAIKSKWVEAIVPYVQKCCQARAFLNNTDGRLIGDIDTESTIDYYSQVYKIVSKEADASILITGETGTGKSYLAREIHDRSQRAAKPFMRKIISNIPKDLLYSELFGHKKGTFTGAINDQEGILEAAKGGTVFLDEIGDLPLEEQGHLLTALDTREIYRLNENKPRPIDVRFIFATNKNIKQLIIDEKFRADLYYRIAVATLFVKPLRERKSDIELLANHFLKKYLKNTERKVTDKELHALSQYHFPGNIRQLENIVERSVLLDIDLDESLKKEEAIQTSSSIIDEFSSLAGSIWNSLERKETDLNKALDMLEKLIIKRTIDNTHSNKEAADMLGLTLSTFETKKRKYFKNQ